MPKKKKQGGQRRQRRGQQDSQPRSQVTNIPQIVVPDKLVLVSAEPALTIAVTANTGNTKWLAFSNAGYYLQDGGGGITSNSWIGDYWGNVVEKAFDYYAYIRVLQIKVQMITPALHVAGQLGAYKHAQCAVVPANQRDTAFGSDLSGFSTCKLIPMGSGYTITVHPSDEARRHSVPSIIDSQQLKIIQNAAQYQFQTYPMFRIDPVNGTSQQGDLLATFYTTLVVELSGRLGAL